MSMSNISIEIDSARAILKTYHQVHDNPQGARQGQTKHQNKNKTLEQDYNSLKEKYLILQNELNNREERLARLNRQLVDKTESMTRLQEDYENAIYQLTNRQGTVSANDNKQI